MVLPIGCYLHPIFVLFREDRLYCDQCYKEQFVPRCAKCQDFITSVRIIIIIWNVLDRIIYYCRSLIEVKLSIDQFRLHWDQAVVD